MTHALDWVSSNRIPVVADSAAAATFVDRLRDHATTHPDRAACTFLDSEGEEVATYSYADLDRRARAIAAELGARAAFGERVLLLYAPGIEFVAGFFGCLYAGAVAVPLPAPRPGRNGRGLNRISNASADATAKFALTSASALAKTRERLGDAAHVDWIATDAIDDARARDWRRPAIDGDTLAMLQYTSGSTSAPRGVMVTHRNLLHNQELISRACGLTADDVVVSWLPTFHDMGLIGFVLQPIFAGAQVVLFSPAAFLQQPLSWLRTISRYRAYATGGPDFAYDLCARTVTDAQKEDLDLSSLKVAFSGSEPVRAETLKRFTSVFEPCGFSRKAFLPSYGLAEATLFVSGCLHADDPTFLSIDSAALALGHLLASESVVDGRQLVGCGPAGDGLTVRIIDPHTSTPVAPGEVGEIWVKGDSVARGYWQKPVESEHHFRAMTATHEGPFLRTGDLGVLHGRELFVTGRLKDLIIIRGQNYYPHDVEQTVEGAHALVRASCVAAFSVDAGGEEKLVIALETDPRKRSRERDADIEPLAATVRAAVSEKHDLEVHAVLVLEPGTIPKTSSGKIQRSACRDAWIAGELQLLGASVLSAALVQDDLTREQLLSTGATISRQLLVRWLIHSLAGLIGISPVGLKADEAIVHIGADSLRIMEWGAAIEARFGARLSLESLANGASFDDLATFVLAELSSPGRNTAVPLVADPDHANEPFPLTDIQQAYIAGRTAAYQLGGVGCHVYFEFDIQSLDAGRLERAWQRLIDRHDMLRTIVNEDGTQQVLAGRREYKFGVADVRDELASQAALLQEVRRELSNRVFAPAEWPLFDLRFTNLPEGTRLHFAIDLLIADASSLLLLFSEWMHLYKGDPELPPLEVTFRDYVIAASIGRAERGYDQSLLYWREQLDALPPAPELPLAKDPSLVQQAAFTRRTRALDPKTWSTLRSMASEWGVTASGLLLAAYAEVLARWSKRGQFTLNLTISDRQPLHPDVARIVGDFTSIVLVPFDRAAGADFRSRATRVQEQLWRNLDHRIVSGVQVIRELAQRGHGAQAAMPVVFTSTLDTRDRESIDESAHWLGAPVFGVSRTPQVWLDHSVSEYEGALTLNWDAVEELFPAGLLDDLVSANASLLELLAEGAQIGREASIELLPAHQLARRALANDTEVTLPGGTLASLFEQSAERSAGQLALVAGTKRMTYAELSRRSAGIAAQLVQRAVQPGAPVAIVMESGWEQVVAAVGIARAGAAYVPIDAALPTDRLLRVLAHSQASMVITQPAVEARVAWPLAIDRIVVTDHDDGAEVPTPSSGSGALDLAYVIYTSGSTGEPKGVAIDHRGAVNTIDDLNARFAVSSADRVLALSSLSFDLSVYDIFGMLAAGAAIVHPCGEMRDPGVWADLIERERITIWNSVPALAEMLADSAAARKSDLSSLRLIMMSGDWIPVTLPDRLRAVAPNAQIISLGGATEASIWSIWHPITEVDPAWKSIPYGRPLANQRVHVLNASFEHAPDWVPGNLYIGGIGLAKGYWRDEETTNRRFIRHPRTGERLYDTGDLGRYLPDGTIEFLGREDFQTKIQGFRVELSEIETVLVQHGSVRSAVVVAAGEKQGHKRLVAYVVPNGNAPDDSLGVTLEGVGAVPDRLSIAQGETRRQFKEEQRGVRSDLEAASFVALPSESKEDDLDQFRARRSARRFQREPIALDRFAAFLAPLRQIDLDGAHKRQYPSAGGLYPVQIYVHVKDRAVDGLEEGLYYYQPTTHQLLLLGGGNAISRELHVPYNRAIFDSSAFSLFLIGNLSAVRPMYGDLARDFSLLEAGYMSQLLMQSAAEKEIGLCPIGVVAFGSVEHLFRLQDDHVLLHAHVGGAIAADDALASEPLVATGDIHVRPAVHAAGLIESLRNFAAARLPRYMVPSSFVLLDALPLSRNGKVDRAALPLQRNEPLAEWTASSTAPGLEARLLEIVRGVLQTDDVERDRNLFDIGANSIHLVQIHGKVQELIGQEFSVVDMFQYPSVAALADHLHRRTVSSDVQQSRSRATSRREAMSRRTAARATVFEPSDG